MACRRGEEQGKAIYDLEGIW